jgi:hypothetical protein
MWTELRWLNKGANGGVIHIFGLFNTLNAKLNPICHLLALLGAHHIFHVSRIRVNNSASASDITASDDWMIGEKGMGKYVEGIGCGVI